jgi:hypothetical protein
VSLLRVLQPTSALWGTAINLTVKSCLHPSNDFVIKALGLDRFETPSELPERAEEVVRQALAALMLIGGFKDILRPGGHVKVLLASCMIVRWGT